MTQYVLVRNAGSGSKLIDYFDFEEREYTLGSDITNDIVFQGAKIADHQLTISVKRDSFDVSMASEGELSWFAESGSTILNEPNQSATFSKSESFSIGGEKFEIQVRQAQQEPKLEDDQRPSVESHEYQGDQRSIRNAILAATGDPLTQQTLFNKANSTVSNAAGYMGRMFFAFGLIAFAAVATTQVVIPAIQLQPIPTKSKSVAMSSAVASPQFETSLNDFKPVHSMDIHSSSPNNTPAGNDSERVEYGPKKLSDQEADKQKLIEDVQIIASAFGQDLAIVSFEKGILVLSGKIENKEKSERLKRMLQNDISQIKRVIINRTLHVDKADLEETIVGVWQGDLPYVLLADGRVVYVDGHIEDGVRVTGIFDNRLEISIGPKKEIIQIKRR